MEIFEMKFHAPVIEFSSQPRAQQFALTPPIITLPHNML